LVRSDFVRAWVVVIGDLAEEGSLMFRFESVSYLQLLWLVAVLVGLSIVGMRRALLRLNRAFGEKLTPVLSSSVSKKKRNLKLALQALTLALMIVALSRPQAGQSKQEVRSEGVEIMLLADVSESMLADDLRPSRLEQAKVDMNRLIDLLAGNKVGVVAFAGSAALLSPLTNDPSALKLFVDSLTPASVSSQGTNFKEALEGAKSAFERGGVEKDEGIRVTRVILIFSDGEDHEPGALDLAKKLNAEGTKIFTIAYGTEKGAPIPLRDSLGYLKGYKKDAKNNTVLTTVNGEALKSLAQTGGGSFFFASPGAAYLQHLIEDINKLEKSQFDSQMAVQYDEKFQIFLLLSLLAGLTEIFLGERRADFRLWRGRFEVPPA
jgi:Ca-activated chloride channel homolog